MGWFSGSVSAENRRVGATVAIICVLTGIEMLEPSPRPDDFAAEATISRGTIAATARWAASEPSPNSARVAAPAARTIASVADSRRPSPPTFDLHQRTGAVGRELRFVARVKTIRVRTYAVDDAGLEIASSDTPYLKFTPKRPGLYAVYAVGTNRRGVQSEASAPVRIEVPGASATANVRALAAVDGATKAKITRVDRHPTRPAKLIATAPSRREHPGPVGIRRHVAMAVRSVAAIDHDWSGAGCGGTAGYSPPNENISNCSTW